MNAELPPFKNEEHNSESASTIDRVITSLRLNENNFLLNYSGPMYDVRNKRLIAFGHILLPV